MDFAPAQNIGNGLGVLRKTQPSGTCNRQLSGKSVSVQLHRSEPLVSAA
jgi:hypothetical protein